MQGNGPECFKYMIWCCYLVTHKQVACGEWLLLSRSMINPPEDSEIEEFWITEHLGSLFQNVTFERA
jgi:hypothetical protein